MENKEYKFCTQCGAKMPKDVKFCTSCGKVFETKAITNNKNEKTKAESVKRQLKESKSQIKKSRKTKLPFFISIIGIAVVFVSILYFTGKESNTEITTDLYPVCSSLADTIEEIDAGDEELEAETILESEIGEEITKEETIIEETLSNGSEYIIPYSNTQYLTEKDVEELSKEEIRIAINEIYARHGRAFETEDLNAYFSSKGWYQPQYFAEEFRQIEDSVLNEYEKENIKFLAAIRDGKNPLEQTSFDSPYGIYELHTETMDAVLTFSYVSGGDYEEIILESSSLYGSAFGAFDNGDTLSDGKIVSEKEGNYTLLYEGGNVIECNFSEPGKVEVSDSNTYPEGIAGFSGIYYQTQVFSDVSE